MKKLVIFIGVVFVLFNACQNDKRGQIPQTSEFGKKTNQIDIFKGELYFPNNSTGFHRFEIAPGNKYIVQIINKGTLYIDHVDYEPKYKEVLLIELTNLFTDTTEICDETMIEHNCTYLFECYAEEPIFESQNVSNGCFQYVVRDSVFYLHTDIEVDFQCGGLLDHELEADFFGKDFELSLREMKAVK